MADLRTQRTGTITISTDRAWLDIDVIHAELTESYWSKGIPKEIIGRAIQQSICYGVYDHSLPARASELPQQIGFARVITDEATYAYLADVFILEAHRGKGYSKLLMSFIMETPELQGLRRFTLATRDAHSLYAQYGFTPLKIPDRFMEIVKPDIYLKN